MMILQEELEERRDLQPYLFCRGFLLTTEKQNIQTYPFFGNWQETILFGYYLYHHSWQKLTIHQQSGLICFMIGHAYNPFTMQEDEKEILEEIATAGNRIGIINQLTGIFGIISENGLEVHTDASGMQPICYGKIGNHVFISSHMRLIGDLKNLPVSDYVHRLVAYRWYPRMLGNHLPGELTCFDELKRVIPNTFVVFNNKEFKVSRFYLSEEIQLCLDNEGYNAVIQEACRLLHNTMVLIARKREKPSISLTGGIDSNTTFAAANGLYDRYTAFSYVSIPRELMDAEQAEKICERFNVPWKRYDIPGNNKEIPDYSLFKAILEWNDGGTGGFADSDIRKKAVLIQNEVCDVEVKSWISETVRAYAYKYFGRKTFPKRFTARNYTSLYKVFLWNRQLARETDEAFRQYREHTHLKEHLFNYDESDFFVWEMMHGGKCGLDIGVMKTCFDITIPYNNRNLLDLLLHVPLEKRLSDQLHLDMKKTMYRELYDMNIRVINANETKLRKRILSAYFDLNSKLPV